MRSEQALVRMSDVDSAFRCVLTFAMNVLYLKTILVLGLVSGVAFAGDPPSPKTLDAIRNSKVAADSGDDAEAIAILDVAIRDGSNDGILFLTRGLLLQRNKQDDLAIADFSRSIKLGFRPALSYASRGTCHLSGADPKMAMDDFNSALLIDPKLSIAHLLRGRLLYESGRLSDALRDLDLAIQLDPNAESYITRALYYLKLKDYAAACSDCSTAAALNPTDPDPLWLRAATHRKRGDEAAAISDCKLAERLETIHLQR